MIPTRTLRATVEISTGSMIITNRPPAFTGEADALAIAISLLNGGAAYSPVGNVVAQLYLYWPGTVDMSESVELTISGSTLTGTLPDTLTAVPGCPLLVVQLTDADTSDLIVAAASPIQITNVLGERVISTRPATPSEIIYIGRAPYVDTTTGHWMQWDVATSGYIDTGVDAYGRPATFTATATTLPAGSAATASISGTPDAPVLNLGIPKGQDSAVLSVNGKTGAVQLNDEHIPSTAVSGQTTVEGALSSLSTNKVPSARKVNNKALTADITLNDEDIPSTAVSGATTVEGALVKQSQQITNLDNALNNGTFIPQGDDLNNYVETGAWRILFDGSKANTPETSLVGSYGTLYVRKNLYYVSQIVVGVAGLAIRISNNSGSTWQSWIGYGNQILESALATIAYNDTHTALTKGQYIYIKNHSSLTEGLYIANENIGTNGALSGKVSAATNVLNSKSREEKQIVAQENYKILDGNSAQVIRRGNIVEFNTIIQCVSPYANYPGIPVFTGLPTPYSNINGAVTCNVVSYLQNPSDSITLFLNFNGTLAIRNGVANHTYNIHLVYLCDD